MAKYFRLKIAKKSITEVFIKTDDKKTRYEMFRYPLADVIENTVYEYDWDDFGWEEDVEVLSVKEVKEEEAKQFKIWDAEKGEAI